MTRLMDRRSILAASAGSFALFGGRAAAQAGKGRTFLIFFDFEKSEIVSSAQQIVHAIGKALLADAKVTVAGNADLAEGDPERLSLRRAAEVLKALAGLQAPKGVQFTVVGRGNAAPLVKTGPGVREPQNRRVEITVV